MTEITVITEDGEQFAKVPLGLWQTVSAEIEAHRDSAVIAGASREARDYIPLEVASRIWDGVSPVRAWREHRRMTQNRLAEATGMARAFLSQVETGKRDLSVKMLQKVAMALNADISFLVPVD